MAYNFTRLDTKFKFKLVLLIVFTIILSFLIFERILQSALKEMKEDINAKFDSIDHNLQGIFQNSKHTIYNIAEMLSEEEISKKNKNINKIFNYFTSRSAHQGTSPFTGIVLIDANGDTVANTVTNSDIHNKIQTSKHSICLKLSDKKDPFELKIFSIMEGMFVKKMFVPMVMSIVDINKKYIGTICAGIYTDTINEKLSARYAHTKYFDHIKLLNNKSNDPNVQRICHDLESVLTISSILKSYLNNYDLIVFRDLKNHPFTIEMKIKPAYLGRLVRIYCLFILEYLGIFIIFSFLLYFIVRNYYRDPLLSVNKKLTVINDLINKKPLEILAHSGDNLLNRKFYPYQFSNNIDSLIDSYYLLETKAEKQLKLKFKQKILGLLLTEHHFLGPNGRGANSEGNLYVNKLISIIDEECVTMSLVEFLTKVTGYCCEFYHEFNFNIVVKKKDQKDFTFKHAALTEAIVSLVNFVVRGNFDTWGNEITIKGEFINNNHYPSIAIEVNISNEVSTTLGWSFGPVYVYTGLLSVYLLAKENNLFFNIKGKNNKMIFSFEPLNKKIEFYKERLC